jgi:aminoglycoside phosphotransferase (APT) family kinase protein
VCVLIAGLTAVTFDVPSTPPPPASALPPKVELTPASIPDRVSAPAPTQYPKREQINETLARAMRNLADVPAVPASVIGAPGSSTPQVDTKVFGVVSKLGEAMRIARDAHDDKDLARAEDLMRSVRQEMDAVCDKAGGSGPLCQSAEQIRSLGY